MKHTHKGALPSVANTVNNMLQKNGINRKEDMLRLVNSYAVRVMGFTPEISHKKACKHIVERFYSNFSQWVEYNK